MLVPKGTYVRIRTHILKPGERSEHVPEDTQLVPLKCWIKGWLLEEAELYEPADIETATGRRVRGTVKEVRPPYRHHFGDYVDELMLSRKTILQEMWGEDDE